MAVIPGYWGIDIGQCALKAIRLQIIDGKVTATAFDYVEHPKILSQPDADPELLTREALEKFLSRNPLKGDKVAIGVAGQSGLARFVKLPPVEEKKIDDIVKFEAKQQIPFPLDEVVWDYQKVSSGAVEGGFAVDTEIGLFAMKRDLINRVLTQMQAVNVDVHTIQMSPLALCNYITYDMLNKGGPDAPADAPAAPAPGTKRKCLVALDVGTDGSNLIITDGGKIIWQRPIPIGGNHFTRALTKELKLTFAKAEHLKRNAAKSPELANILRALKPVLTDFVGEVQRSLGYFTNTHRDAQIEYLVGLGSAFKLPGLQKYLGDKLQIRVEKPAKYLRLAGEPVTNSPVFIENILTFPVAYGLALQSLGVARLQTNLLPPEIAWDRKIKAKKPWAVAAAACLLIGTGVLAFGAAEPYAAVNDPKITDSLKKAKEVNDQARVVDTQIAAKKKEVDENLEKVLAVIAGKDERFNAMRFNEFINNCIPVPGENGNMNSDKQKLLWNNADGVGGGSIAATRKYTDRIKNGVDPKLAFLDDDLRQYLATVDVEAVHCRYTNDLAGFFKNAKKYCIDYVGTGGQIFHEMNDADRAPMMQQPEVFPTGDGWVCEIRGTTWYEQDASPTRTTPPIKGQDFLERTILANLKAAALIARDPALYDVEKKKPRISHIFLYNTWKDEKPRPDTYHFICTSLINELIPGPVSATGEGSGSGEGGRPLPSGTTGSPTTSTTWKPLTPGDVGVAASAGGGGAVAPPVGGGGTGATSTYKRSAIPKDAGNTAVVPKDPKDKDMVPKTEAKPKPRYEFVIVFVWKEPTPSDKFITKPTAVPAPPAQPAQPTQQQPPSNPS